MKKLIVVLVVVVFLVVAPWGIGKLAEQRLDRGVDKLLEVAPYLTVVERKYTRGWFKSEQVVTFEAFSSWMKALSPKALEEAMKAGAQAGEGAVEPGADAQPGSEADAAASEDAPVVDEAPKLEEMMRFTVRNDVLHGPILGLSGFGVARVNTHLVLDEKIRKDIEKTFGSKPPIEVTTRVGFLGGGTTTVKSEGRTIKAEGSTGEITWETAKLSVGYSGDLDNYDIDGTWPKVEVIDKDQKSSLVMTDMTLDGDGKRIKGDLYEGDFDLAVDKASYAGGGEKFEVNDIHYLVNTESPGEFTSVSAKLGVGEVKSKELSDQGIHLKEIHYDISVRRLHTETLVKILEALKTLYAKPLASSLEAPAVMLAPFKEHGAELLDHDPEFVVDRIGIVTAEGDGYIKGVVKLKGATAEDFAAGAMSMIGKVHADFTIDVSEKMLQKLPNGSTAAGAAVDAGYAKREGDRLVCKIVFADGQFTVNGKPQAIPGLGAPPPGVEAEEPPPQE